MGEPVKPAHENDSVDAHLPLLLEHAAKALAEVLGAGALGGLVGLNELLGFGPSQTKEADSKREAGADPEHGGPRLGRTAGITCGGSRPQAGKAPTAKAP